jgi:hypothetical protein
LRTTFVREHKKTSSQKSGDGADTVYVSKWKHYNKLLFLRDTITADESQSNLNTSQELSIDINSDDTDNTITSLDDIPSPNTSTSSSQSARKKRRQTNDKKSELYEMAAKVLSTPEEKDDEELAFCRSLAASLRRFNPQIKEIVKLELQQVIVRHTHPQYYQS